MTLNEKMAQILAIAEDDKRQASVSRAEKNKPKLVNRLMNQAKIGIMEGLMISDDDRVYVKHLADFFHAEGFSVEEVEPTRQMVTVAR